MASDFITCIELAPVNARQNVIKSMIGSMNSSIIGNLRSHLRQKEREFSHLGRGIERLNEEAASADEAIGTERFMNDAGQAKRMSSIEAASHVASLRGYLVHYLGVVAQSRVRLGGMLGQRNDALTITDTVNFQLERAADVNELQVKAMATALNMPYEALRAAKVQILEDEKAELNKFAGEIITIAADIDRGIVDAGDAVECFEQLPAATQYRMFSSLATAMKKAMDNEMKRLLRYNRIESAGDITLLKGSHNECVSCVIDLTHRMSAELDEYIERGGSLPELEMMS